MPSYIRTRTEFAVNSFTADNQTAPSVSTFADGSFIVVWGTWTRARTAAQRDQAPALRLAEARSVPSSW